MYATRLTARQPVRLWTIYRPTYSHLAVLGHQFRRFSAPKMIDISQRNDLESILSASE